MRGSFKEENIFKKFLIKVNIMVTLQLRVSVCVCVCVCVCMCEIADIEYSNREMINFTTSKEQKPIKENQNVHELH